MNTSVQSSTTQTTRTRCSCSQKAVARGSCSRERETDDDAGRIELRYSSKTYRITTVAVIVTSWYDTPYTNVQGRVNMLNSARSKV